MIPDRTQLGTLYIKTDDGEYQELGKTTSVEYACDVASLPTLNLELRCTYEQNKKEKEVKEMTYEELVKTLPKIEIDGVPIEYGKTKVIYTYNSIDYEGLIVYNDDSDMLNLLFLSDTKCYDFNSVLDTISNEVENTLNFTFDEKKFEYRNQWADISDLKLAPKKTDIHITTSSGLKIDTTGLTTISCNIDYPYITYDTRKTKDFYEKYCLGKWNTEEKKERGNEMELINIFEEKSKKNISDYYDNELEKHKNDNKLKSQFEAIVKEANEKIRKLYESQDLTKDNLYQIVENPALVTQIGYKLQYTGSDKAIREIRELEKDELSNIDELLNEVNAQIECIEEHSDNEYEEIMNVLKDYNIVDEKGKIKPYVVKKRHIYEDEEGNIYPSNLLTPNDKLFPTHGKRRGRKPSKKSE